MSKRDEERDPGVLGGLSRTRPQRRSGRRPAGPAAAQSTSPVKARAKPVAKQPKASAKASSKPPVRGTIRQPSQPRNVPKQPAARAPREPEETHGPSPVVTAAQAAGELAQIGLTVGTQAIKGVLSRLPRP